MSSDPILEKILDRLDRGEIYWHDIPIELCSREDLLEAVRYFAKVVVQQARKAGKDGRTI